MPDQKKLIARSTTAAASAGSRPKDRSCNGPKHDCRLSRSSPYAVISVDPEMRVTRWNPAAERIFGHNEEEMLGKPLMGLVPDRYRSAKHTGFTSFLETGKGPFTDKPLEIEGLRKDGTEVPIELFLLENDGDGSHSATAIVCDISRRRQAEIALQKSEKRLQTVFEQSDDCMFFVDPDTKQVFYTNRALPRLLGYGNDEVSEFCCGNRPMTLYDFEHDEESIDRLCDKVLKHGRFVGERYYRRRDEYLVAMDVCATATLIDDRKAIRVVSRDATLRKKMEGERRKADELQKLSVLSAQTCHDINNLITSILNNASAARIEFEGLKNPAEPVRSFLGMLDDIKDAGLRAAELIRKLKEAAKAGEHEKKPKSVQRLLKKSAALASSYPGIEADLIIPGEAWAVVVDELQISRVFDNLFVNAAQAIQGKEGKEGKIAVYVENVDMAEENDLRLKEGKYVKISIQDNGVGIAEEDLQFIFDPDFTTKPKGSGLGLAISKSVVMKHGGCITVESVKGHGTTFHVYLPASEEFEKGKHITGDYEPLG